MEPPVPPPVDPRGLLQQWASKWLNPQEPPEGWRGWPARFVGFLQSIPAAIWIVVLMFVAMVVAASVAWTRFRLGSDHAPWEFLVDWRWIASVVILVVAVPLLAYRELVSWRHRPSSEYAELDADWERGLRWLHREGVELRATPVFLILGLISPGRERSLFRACRPGTRIVEEGGGHLGWYVARDAVFVSIRGAGVTGDYESLADPPTRPGGADRGPGTGGDPERTRDRHRALAHLAARLRTARGTSCACNGVLVVVPFGWLDTAPLTDDRLPRAIHSDLVTLQRTTGCRPPVAVLIDGVDRHPGFAELVRRVGRDRATTQRFGHRYEVGCDTIPEDVERLADHACGAFEDWVHVLFREQHVLSRTGNESLYSLLSRVRLRLVERLRRLLRDGVGSLAQRDTDDDAIVLTGCYFCGVGPDGEQWAFAGAVLEKLVDENHFVEWVPSTRRADRSRRFSWRAAMTLNAALLVSLVVLLVASGRLGL